MASLDFSQSVRFTLQPPGANEEIDCMHTLAQYQTAMEKLEEEVCEALDHVDDIQINAPRNDQSFEQVEALAQQLLKLQERAVVYGIALDKHIIALSELPVDDLPEQLLSECRACEQEFNNLRTADVLRG